MKFKGTVAKEGQLKYIGGFLFMLEQTGPENLLKSRYDKKIVYT